MVVPGQFLTRADQLRQPMLGDSSPLLVLGHEH